MLHPRLLPLIALLLIAPSALSQAPDPLIGTFADDRLTLTLVPSPTGTGYTGTVALAGAKTFPLTATLKQGAPAAPPSLTGQFTDATRSFPFTARLDPPDPPDTLVLQTGETTYRLARRVEAPARKETDLLPPPAPRDVEAAITRAKAYLYAMQTAGGNGHWDLPQRLPMPTKDFRSFEEIQNSTQWGGLTALATYTLLTAGEAPSAKPLAAAIAFLKEADLDGTYALACRLLVWNALPQSARKDARELAKRDRDLLLKNKRPDGAAKGLFRYLSDDVGADFSASQFAVLGLWAADQLGAEVPAAFWRETESAWLAAQLKDGPDKGGWPYAGPLLRPEGGVRPSMTAAGVATLFITADALRGGGAAADCRGNPSLKPLDAGIAWIDAHADEYFLTGNNAPFYALYGLERIGLASGLKYLGKSDWYRRGAHALLAAQNPDGSWGNGVADTCFATLFLTRGRAPLVLNKLQYTLSPAPSSPLATGNSQLATPPPAHWNQRPRDAANVTRYLSQQLEREFAWQIVDLSAKPEDLHDAPILYLAGNQQLAFSPADEDKLRTFVHQGGLILGHADCASPLFATSFKKLGQKLFPPYEFRELPASHPLYHQAFPRTAWKVPPQVQALSNGARELMILLPTGDPARYWQTASAAGHEPSFQLLADTFLYCSETGAASGPATASRDFRHRGESTWIPPDPNVTTTRTLKIARLRHDFNWNPEPGGWQRLKNLLHNQDGVDLQIDTIKLGDNKLTAKDYPLAHLTAAGRMTLTDPQRAELKSYLAAGGTLLLDATAGDPEAATALESEISSLLPHPSLSPLPPDHPLYAHLRGVGIPTDPITLRPYALKRTTAHLTGPRLRAPTPTTPSTTPHLLYSPEDLSAALVGQPIDGIYGYTPASATAIVRSIILGVAAP